MSFTTVTVTLAVNADSAEAWTIIDEWVGTTAPHSVDSVSIHAEPDGPMTKWVIICIDEGSDGELFWNNNQGWTSLDDANVFTNNERQQFNLPMGGAWISHI